MIPDSVEYLIVGSGACGATLARELSKKGKNVVVVERGHYSEKIGGLRWAKTAFDLGKRNLQPPTSEAGVRIWRGFHAGGSTVIAVGNATRCLEAEMVEFGIDLEREFKETEEELNVAPLSERLISDGSQAIRQAAENLGYAMHPMPKFLYQDKCLACGACQLGCRNEAKWSALEYLHEAEEFGAQIEYGTLVQEVLVDNGRAYGIRGKGVNGLTEIRGETVILAAGGMASPVILQRSGIQNAGSGFFADMLINVYGITQGLNLMNEPQMAIVNHQWHEEKGFILASFLAAGKTALFLDVGPKGLTLPRKNMIGIMIKTADDSSGKINPDGTFIKPITPKDQERFDEGSSIATEILTKAGADPESIFVSKIHGGHPGGTAAVGKVVDNELQTEIENLYVCDASVLPKAPGLPPILTLVALAKWLAGRLVN
jgi:choline dehydrogenase-like flavoprotein